MSASFLTEVVIQSPFENLNKKFLISDITTKHVKKMKASEKEITDRTVSHLMFILDT